MRGWKIVSGIAVLFMSLHMVHAVHHFLHMRNEMPAWMWGGLLGLGVLTDVLSFVGGIFLVTGK